MSRTGMVPSARSTADLPATTGGVDRLSVKVSACANAGPADVASARAPSAAARVYLAFMRAAKLGGGPQWPLNPTSTRRLREHDGRLYLTVGDVPVRAQELGSALGPHVLEAVPLVEADGPGRGSPRAHQHRPRGSAEQML